MKGEIIIFIITAFFILNTYHDNKYTQYLKSMKKYYTMAIIGFAGLSFYLFIKKYPNQAFTGIGAARQLLKTLPVDKSAGYLFDPIVNGTFNTTFFNKDIKPYTGGINNVSSIDSMSSINNINKRTNNETKQSTTKRSVSETKKKYIASQQGWKCGNCNNQLNAWFEVDHKHSLETGGTNHISNLIALCRECHGKKTAFERMGIL
jgi:5-methylcytosine-specific restriction endonuclease McrA